MARGALRKGEALLAGLLRCGHCGRKLHVGYTGKNGNTSRYICRGASINHGASGKCIAFGAIRIDQGVSAEVPRLLRPVGVEAAIHAIEQCAGQGHAKRRQAELALEQSRFEAARAQRQFDAVDPGNRLVFGGLERRWNERVQVEMTMSLHCRDQDRDQWLQPLAADPITSLPQHDERLANGFVVHTVTHWHLLLDSGSCAQDPGRMLAVVSRE